MALQNIFRFGSAANNLQTLAVLGVELEPICDPLTYKTVVVVADGSDRKLGKPNQVLHFDGLSEDEADIMRAYDGTTVYMETQVDDGSWATYSGLYVWPHPEPEHRNDYAFDINVEVRRMTPFTE